MSSATGDETLGYTMRDLNQRTGQVMDEIQKNQRPAYITRHGRFMAKIIPLEPGKVASAVSAALAGETGPRRKRPGRGDGGRAMVYSMRDLSQRTGPVMDWIQKNRRPAYITRRGRFIAMIVPFEPGEVESAVLAAMAEEIGQQYER